MLFRIRPLAVLDTDDGAGVREDSGKGRSHVLGYTGNQRYFSIQSHCSSPLLGGDQPANPRHRRSLSLAILNYFLTQSGLFQFARLPRRHSVARAETSDSGRWRIPETARWST